MISKINQVIGKRLASFLTKPLRGYQRLDTVSVETIGSVLETGDVLLVEGNTRISVAIKYLTQSSWSHACLFVGNQGALCSEPCLLEADLNKGVRLVPLQQYAEFNLRICRPVSLNEEDKKELVEFARSKLGQKYDLKNVVDLARYLIQKPAVPNRYRRAMISLGSSEPTKAICSTLIAESFQSINYPILPRTGDGKGINGEVPQFYKRHFTHFTPRDLDLSPYFRVVKPSVEEGFNFREFNWLHDNESTQN
ncbi:MAG: YiiX/YebB-like N1pC/P60 family cysteine hydrolase [Pseudohongiellaceae bacterium]